jgi:hypothetical protein
MDTQANPDIVKAYFYWLGQLQNPGDVLISSVFTSGFLEVASQAWNVDSADLINRQTFSENSLDILLQDVGYSLIDCIEYDETNSMRRFFPWITANPGKTDLLFIARKSRVVDNLSALEREALTQWLEGYITCNPYPNQDFDIALGELQMIRRIAN